MRYYRQLILIRSHKGSSPPPPLNRMLKRILHLFIFSPWGIKSATPPGHYVEWDIAFNISPYRTKSATLSDHYVGICWMGYYLQLTHIWGQIRHPLWPLCWMRYYLQRILIGDQIRHPLWPLYWMGYYLQSILIRDQIRHPLWPLNLMRYYLILPSTSFCKVSKPPTFSEHSVEWDIAFNLSP